MASIIDEFLRSFQIFSQEIAIKLAEKTYTYAQLFAKVEDCRKRLAYLQAPKQAIIAFDGAKPLDAIVLLLACLLQGHILFLLNRYLPPFFLQNQLRNVPIHCAIVEKKLGNLCVTPDVFFSSTHQKASSYTNSFSPSAPYTMMFTSGTTAAPKIALHSAENHLYSALAIDPYIPLTPGDTWLLSMPLYHVAGIGIVFRCLFRGAAIRIPDLKDSLSPDVTHVSVVETTLRRLISSSNYHQLRYIMLGGSPISSDLEKLCEKHSLPMLYSYGLTEMSSHVCTSHRLLRKNTCVCFGCCHRQALVKIEQGELYVRGKTLFLGYYPQQSASSSWFATKDRATIDQDGRVWICGRKDRQFISGGENIQPEEIEKALCACPGIEAATVVPKPHPEYGMRPIAIVRAHQSFDENLVKKELRKHLAAYKIPDKIFLEQGRISSLQGKFY